MQAKRVWCKAAESVRGASGVAEALAAGGGGRTSGAPGVSISSTLPGIEERVEEGDVGPSSAGPQQKLGPGSSSAIALTQPMPLHWLLLLFALLGLQLQPKESALTNRIADLAVPARRGSSHRASIL